MNAPIQAMLPAASIKTESDEEVIKRLAALSAIRYDQVRIEEAKRLNIQVKTLDKLVKAERGEDKATCDLPFLEYEAHSEAVSASDLLNEISQVIKEYVVLDVEQADVAALWVVHTYLIDVADVSPIAIINAPERACAKTLFQTVLGRMVYRPLPASNASLSALFRFISSWQPTILLDEGDTFFKDNAELHGMINAGYKKGGSLLRSEAVGDSFEPKSFPVYCAKSIAGIALERHLPDSTMSRGIIFNMRRKLPHEIVKRYRYAEDSIFETIASKLVRFAHDNEQKISQLRPHLPEELSDRAQDNFEPLFAIAMCAGDAWVQRATQAALKMSAASEDQTSSSNELLADIKDVLAKWTGTTIRTVDLIDLLVQDVDMGWATYNRGKPLSPRQLAKHLGVYGIKPKTVRQKDGTTPKGYDINDFIDAFARYLKVATTKPILEVVAEPAAPVSDVAATTPHGPTIAHSNEPAF